MVEHIPDDGQAEPEGPPNWGPNRPWAVANTAKPRLIWLVGGVVVVVVLALIAALTMYVTSDDPESPAAAATPAAAPQTPRTAPTAGVASSKDTAAVAVVTDDPTCTGWTGVDAALAAVEQSSWSGRDPSVPTGAWTASRRASYDTAATAMRSAADQIAPLARQTPHRVMRELYEQTAAYLTAYADAIPAYTAVDDHLVQSATSISSTLSSICESIADGSSATRSGLAPPAAEPAVSVAAAGGTAPFLRPPADPVCGQWHAMVAKYTSAFADWRAIDPNTAAAQWNPAQRNVIDTVRPIMVAFADEAEGLAAESPNGVLQDFLTLAAQYRRAYAAALPTYVPADGALTRTASAMTGAIDEGCLAIEG